MLKLSDELKKLLDLYGHYDVVKDAETGEVTKSFDWKNAIIDAIIFSAIGLFTTYASALTTGVSPVEALHTAIVAFLLQFVTFLGIKRGLIQQSNKS